MTFSVRSKFGQHAAAEALQHLVGEIGMWRETLDRLEAGQAMDRAEGNAALGRLLDASQHLRDTILSLESSARWETRDQLHELIAHIGNADARRTRYEYLAKLLEAGTVTYRRERKRADSLRLRDAAVTELREIYALASPPDLPGPEIEAWLEWAWSLEEGTDELLNLQQQLPRLDELIAQVESEFWMYNASAESVAVSALPNDSSPEAEALDPNAVAPEVVPGVEVTRSLGWTNPAEQPGEFSALFLEPEFGQMVAEETSAVTQEVFNGDGEAQATDETPTSEQVAHKSPASGGVADPIEYALRPLPVEAQRSSISRYGAPEYDRSKFLGFKEFRARYLLTRGGMLGDAPWLMEGFQDQLSDLISENLSLQGLPRLHLAVRAAKQQGWPCLLNPEAVHRAASLIRTGKSPHGERDEILFGEWAEALLTASEPVAGHHTQGRIGVKLLTVVHAFSSNSPIDPKNLFGGHEAVPFTSTALRNALDIFSHRALTTDRWVEHLRDRLDSNQADRRQMLAERISAAKKELRTVFKEKGTLRGIQRPHCREAWANFMKKIAREKADLLLDAQRDWTRAPKPEDIESWSTTYTRTMDSAVAKYQDRNKMDRAFQDLSDTSTALAQMLRTWNSAQIPQDQGETDSATIGQLNSLFASEPLADPEEELCRVIVRAVLRGQLSESTHLDITLADFIERPQLLELLNELPEIVEGETKDWQSGERIVSIDSVQEPIRVVARFLEGKVPRPEEGMDLLAIFREALSSCGRADLEDRLIPLMDEPEKRRLWSERRQEVEMLQEVAIRISELGGQLGDFTDPQADLIRGYGSDLRGISQTVGRVGLELMLMKAWSRTILETSQELVSGHAESLRGQARENRAVLDALDQKDYARATMLVYPAATPLKGQRLRATWWRNEAKTRIPNPPVYLAEVEASYVRDLPSREKAAALLAQTWLKTKLNSSSSAKKLRTTFLDYVFQSKKANSSLAKLFTDKATRHFINCQDLRDAIAEEGANPSYLPQLADIRSLSIVTPEDVSVSAIVNSVKNLGEDLCIVLAAPRVSEQVKKDVRQGARTKLVAVVDQLDLCRLLELRQSTEIAPLLGLLEIALEQQSWERIDPYRTQDGQHVRMEMFVGRTAEGEKLAKTNDYKKLFSGRKLGKSALLRYVEERFDGSNLPSGNHLRVLYLPIVDHFREDDFVQCLVSEIQRVCEWRASASQERGWPRLQRVVQSLLDEQPRTSLLIVLDEADKFVEEELKSYLHKQEDCLSFHLRSDIETMTDSRQLPRVRFLFAGYRTTNLSEGAWSNWGSTLRLSPLDPDEATALLAGPLARLGIDLRDLAGTVAYRCGYQPAVLLRAGKALLTRMAKQRPVDSWEYIEVRKEDITAVLEENEIREEIRQVIDNNFTQNKLGQIVFHTIVLLLSERQFGYALDDPEDRIMEELKNRDPNGRLNSWLETDERSAKAKITVQLEELQQRRLLVAETVQGEPVQYRLAFPHHVSALGGQQQLSARLQQEIHDLPRAALNPVGNGTLSFFAADEIDSFSRELKEAALEPKENRIVRALLGISHWLYPSEQNPALHPSCGIRALLNYDGPGDREALSAEAGARAIEAENRLLLLMGGADLLRWSQAQTSEDYFYGVAPIRRLGLDELKAWFGVLYEIEVTNKQLEGMYRLTSGIPLLVGELHRLILPSTDLQPPDKLEEPVWSRVQSAFKDRLPSLARELRDGTPAVRLTEREIEILGMVVTASDYGNANTIASDLTETWDQFERPDLKPLGVDDEASVRLLQDLGLLPVRRAFGITSIQAIRPLEHDDAVRRIISHL